MAPVEDSIHVAGCSSVKVLGVGSVEHEPAGSWIEAEHVHRGQSALPGEIHDGQPMVCEKFILLHDEGAHLSGRYACKRRLELGRRAHRGEMECQSQAAGGGVHLGELNLVDGIIRDGLCQGATTDNGFYVIYAHTASYKSATSEGTVTLSKESAKDVLTFMLSSGRAAPKLERVR